MDPWSETPRNRQIGRRARQRNSCQLPQNIPNSAQMWAKHNRQHTSSVCATYRKHIMQIPVFVQNFHSVTPKRQKMRGSSFPFDFWGDHLNKPFFVNASCWEKKSFIAGRCKLWTCWCRTGWNNWARRCAAKSAYVITSLQSIHLRRWKLIFWLGQKCWNNWMLCDFFPMTQTGPHLQLLDVCVCERVCVCKTDDFHLYLCLRKLHCTRLLFVQAHTGLGSSREVYVKCVF